MKKFNKVFKNRQILTSDEMNDIVDIINDIIGQFNESNSDDKYFKLLSSQETIETNTTSTVNIRIVGLDNSIDIRKVKIYWDRDGFNQILNDYAVTSINVSISGTTTFRATLDVEEANSLITKTLTIYAVSPTYIGSGESLENVVNSNGEISSKTKRFNFKNRVSGQVRCHIDVGENLYFFVPKGIEFDVSEVYLDSIVFPLVALSPMKINGIDYQVYMSSGGDYEDIKVGFTEKMEIVLDIF